jgi:hypothetical protein
MAKTFNQDPYYDDFDPEKNFYKVLFKPGVSVQARELTQLQSIQQNQVKQLGDHIFKQGSVVIPGNSFSDLEIPYVKLQYTPTTPVDLTTLIGKTITGNVTGINGFIRTVIPATGVDPITMYIGYRSGGIGGTSSVFLDDEAITVSGLTNVTLQAAATDATGFGAMAFINKGTYYVNGTFALVKQQSLVIGKYTQDPSCHVLLKIVETVVDSEDDESLLDPAQGTYNYAAPGADRYSIELLLTTLPLNSTIGDDYVEIMRYNDGVLEEHSRYPKYNELEKNLARRTYDESGDYVVEKLGVTIREHLFSDVNGGLYPLVPATPYAPAGDRNKFIATVQAGKAYIRGFESEIISNRYLEIDKGRTLAHIKQRDLVAVFPEYGQYIFVTDVKGLPEIKPHSALSLKLFDGTVIGSCKVFGVDYFSTNIYKFFITDLSLNSGRTLKDVASVSYAAGTSIFLHKVDFNQTSGADLVAAEVVTQDGTSKTATVFQYTRSSKIGYFKLHTNNALPDINATCSSGTKFGTITSHSPVIGLVGNTPIFRLPFTSTQGVLNTEYKVNIRAQVSLTAGNGSLSVSGLIIDSFETGNSFASD